MKECDILGEGVKTYSDPSYIFFGVKTPTRQGLRPCHCMLAALHTTNSVK